MVKGVRLELGVGWATTVDLYVLQRLPDVGMVLGTEYMFPRNLVLQFSADRTLAVELTVGQRRVRLQPGPNECYLHAMPTRVQRLNAIQDVERADEAYLCFLTGLKGGATLLETLPAQRAETGDAPVHGEAPFAERLKRLRTEVALELTEQEREDWHATETAYSDVFKDSDYLGTAAPKMDAAYGVHRIPFHDDADMPKTYKRGNVSDAKVAAITEYIQTLLSKGYVTPSESPLGAPGLLVRKPDGKWRFTVDYRAVNNVTKDDRYMPPAPATLYPQMRGAKVFSRVDARDGFWGLPLDPADRWKTAFQTPIGLFEWTVMPMGLKGSPARFQRFMDHILRPHVGKFLAVFVDDIVVWADSVASMHAHLRLLFDTLRAHRVQLKRSKCAFFLKSVRFLGHIVDGEGMSADRDKVAVLAHMPHPENTQDVRSLLGVVGFLRPYIPHVSDYLQPIQKLLKKGAKFEWGAAQIACHDLLVDALLSSPVTALPDAAKEKAIMTDASNYGMGATLLQRQEGRWRPVAFLSQQMTPMQARQSPTVREFFAMAAAVERWQHELANQTTVTIFSDHKPLEALRQQPKLNAIILRRLDELQALDLKVVYKPAAEVGLADWLSRRPDHRRALKQLEAERMERGEPAHPLLAITSALLEGTLVERIKVAQAECPRCQEILQGDRRTDEWRAHYKVHGDLLWSSREGDLRVIVPATPEAAELRADLIREAHDSALGGHLGATKTLERLSRHATWSDMRREVVDYCRACNVCQRTKPSGHASQGPRWPLPIPERKWSWVSLDFVGPFTPGPSGRDYVLVVVDKLTKRVRYLPCTQHTTAEQAALLYYEHVFKHHGWPLRLVSDRGPQFTAEVWQQLWKLTGTTLNLSTAGHPQTDGQSEGAVRVLEQVLRGYVNVVGDDWERYLPSLEFAVNDSVTRTTGFTPFQLEFGQDPITPLAMALGRVPQGHSTIERMRDTLATARRVLREVTERETAAENAKRRPHEFEVGSWAYIRREQGVRTHKLEGLWDRPYEVTAVTPNYVTLRMPGRKHRNVNVSKLRRHYFGASENFTTGQRINEHRFREDQSGGLEIQYRVRGRWYGLDDLVGMHSAWAAVQAYHAHRQGEAERQGVGQLVRRRFGRRGHFLGRTAFFDADTQEYQVVYEDGDHDVFTPQQLARHAYVLRDHPERSNRPRRQTRAPRQYEVARVVQQRGTGASREYLVEWRGYAAEAATWEPLGSFDRGLNHPALLEWQRQQEALHVARDSRGTTQV